MLVVVSTRNAGVVGLVEVVCIVDSVGEVEVDCLVKIME